MRKGKRIAKVGDIVLLESTGKGYFSFGYGYNSEKGEIQVAEIVYIDSSCELKRYRVSKTLTQDTTDQIHVKEIAVLGRI